MGYGKNNTSDKETTFDDRIEYAQKWLHHYFAVKELMASDKAIKTEGQAVQALATSWQEKADNATPSARKL